MSIEIKFHTRNAAFAEGRPEEVCRVLEDIKEKIMAGAEQGIIRDLNGNNIGEWVDEGPEQDES